MLTVFAMSTLETAAGKPLSTTIEPLDDHGSAVRFETQCVVIPDLAHRSRRPRVVTKSYTLPLWKRRTSSPCPTSVPPEDVFPEENQSHVVLRVPLPTYVSRLLCMIRVPNFAPVFRSNLTRRLALLITRLFRRVSCIALTLVPLVPALPPWSDISALHEKPPLLLLAQTSSRYPCARVVRHASPLLRLLSLVVTRGQSIFRVLPRGAGARV